MEYSLAVLKRIFNEKITNVFVKIETLDWDETQVLQEIEGVIVNGNISIDGNSAVRRTISLTFAYDKYSDIELFYRQKIKVYFGVSNLETNYEIIWFPQGVYIITDLTINKNINNINVSIQGADKMCLLDGTISGYFGAAAKLDTYIEKNVEKKILMYDLIKQIVQQYGNEKGKIIIEDIPLTYKQLIQYNGDETLNINTSKQSLVCTKGMYIGYKLKDFVYFSELTVSPNDTIYSILKKLADYMGDYEFFYDVNGNFIFRRKPNYTMVNFDQAILRQNKDNKYVADFSKSPVIYSFEEQDNNIISCTNNFDYKNIKNEFIVWGEGVNKELLHYHVVIDSKPEIIDINYVHPYQQYIIDNLPNNKYYNELSSKFPQIYDKTNQKYKNNYNDYNYWFEIIDENSEIGKYSISKIGARQKVIVDNTVSTIFPFDVPDIIFLPQDTSNEILNEYNSRGIEYLIMDKDVYSNPNIMLEKDYCKDAFTVVREMLYYNTNFNDIITLNIKPLFFLEPNYRIEVIDKNTGVDGQYIINSINISFEPNNFSMSLNASKIYDRI